MHNTGMKDAKKADPKASLATLRTELVDWLVRCAYPLWSENGIDHRNGGFIETLNQNGAGMPHPRRARIHPRQIYSFAQAAGFGWKGDVAGIVGRGMHYFTTHYLRADGLFRTLAGVDGTPLDDTAVLYDQSFALLGYAAAARALDAVEEFETRACALRRAIESGLAGDGSAFRTNDVTDGQRDSNPHMHLLEACLAWAELGTDAGWKDWARNLSALALARFIRKDSGAVGESFTADWQPAPGLPGRVIEPGHQFEWAWLLLRSDVLHAHDLRPAALRLLAIGEQSGVHNQVAINALLDDFSVHDPNARFWPQTERLKAALLAAQITGDDRYWFMAAAAARSFLPFIRTPVPGLWFDVQLPNGDLVDSPAPASTLYHVVGAISVLDRAFGVTR